MTKTPTKAKAKQQMEKKLRSPNWNIRKLYESLGSAEGLIAHMRARGYEPPCLMTVRGWGHRQSIPAKWLLVVLMVAFDERIIRDISQLDSEAA